MSARGPQGQTGMATGRAGRLALLTVTVLAATAVLMTTVVDGSPPVAAARGACKKAARPQTRSGHLHRPLQTVTRADHLVAVVKTNCGSFRIALDARRAPRVVNSFVFLSRSGFYDGLLFYRVVPDFVIQGGSPHNDGIGGPGYAVTEPPPPGFHYRFGTVAMARTASEPFGRAGSNFFVVTGRGRDIKPQYAILGQVSSGLSTIERIAALGTESESPSRPVRIDSIRIRRGG
jgi:peptidyl-prolyl cis-trans isomerase B (cyclophilin B)